MKTRLEACPKLPSRLSAHDNYIQSLIFFESKYESNRTKVYFVKELLIREKSPKEGIKMKKQLLIVLMVTILLATVFVAGCTGDTTNTTRTSLATSTATTTSKTTATPTLSPSPSVKATPVPTATPTKTPAATPTPHVASCSFIGNKHTYKFHYAGCSDVLKMNPENKVCFDTAAQALAAGYVPCKHCNPHD